MMKTIFGELLVDHASATGSVIHLFVAHPTPLEEKNLGRIFALVEFTEPYPFTSEVVQYLDDSFFQSYYRSADFEPEVAFERSLHKVNSAVQDIISQHGEDWIYKTNILLGVMYEQTLHLSYVGKIEAYLAQQGTMVDIIQHPQATEIQPLKLFNNIISGKCAEKSSLMIATSSLLDYLSLEKIRRTIEQQSPAEAVQYFESTLSANDALSNVGAFIIKFETANASTTIEEATAAIDHQAFNQTDNDSMEKLIHQERATGDLLTPSIWPGIKGRLKNIAAKTGDDSGHMKMASRATEQNYVRSESPFVRYLKIAGRVTLNVLSYIAALLVVIGKKLWQLLKRFFKNPDSLSSSLGGSVHGVAGWWRRMSLPRKIFLVLFVVTLFIFIISVLRKDRTVEQAEQVSEYAQTMTEIQNTLGEVESKQIMKDDAGARELLKKAEDLLAGVPKDSAPYLASGETAQQKINELNGVLNKVQTLDQLTQVADFSTIQDAVAITKMSKIGHNMFGFATESDTVYRANLADQAVNAVITGADSESGYRSIENDSAATTLASLAKGSFVQFNPVLEKTTAVTVTLKDKVEVADFDIFSNRLYVLDAKNKRILRLQKSGDSYGQSEVWLDQTDALEKAVSFDIDASIYVLLNDGTIKKYDGGKESEFTPDTFSPSLEGATLLIKSETTTPFYILNPKTQRIVILEPDGKLRKQISHPDLGEATDMIVDEDNQLIYVLSKNKVWSISLK